MSKDQTTDSNQTNHRWRSYAKLWVALMIGNVLWSLVTGDHAAAADRSYFQAVALGLAAWRLA